MISYASAKRIVMEIGQAHRLRTETLMTHDCIGRVCAQDVDAPIDIQPFDNAAMDGFAVRVKDLHVDGGSLKRIGTISAGDSATKQTIRAGQCFEIMTGAPIPPGAQSVVPVELAKTFDDAIHFKSQPQMGANIRRAGEDFKQGSKVLKAGHLIHPQQMMPLASLGLDQLQVYKKPRAVFLATGKELVNDLSLKLKPGQIYNANSPYAQAAMAAMGLECIKVLTIEDDPEHFKSVLSELTQQDIDLIISSGAVSAGKFDFVPNALNQMGAEIVFHKVKLKPGKPVLFAQLPNGTLYFGLAGNPVAAATGLRFFVQPCIRAMMRMHREKPIQAQAMGSYKKRKGCYVFLKAQVHSSKDGCLVVNVLDGQSSFMSNPFLNMNCWAVVPEDVEEIHPGDVVEVYPLHPHSGFL